MTEAPPVCKHPSFQPPFQFINFGKDFCEKMRNRGYWADFIDPCSGLPMLTQDCNKVSYHSPSLLVVVADSFSLALRRQKGLFRG